MNLLGELASYTKLVEKEFTPYLSRDVDPLYKPLRDLMSRGGKRIRPVLCMISCEAVGGKKSDAVKAAGAIEMVHNFTLIHDDIADKSDLRRGKPCIHHTYGLGLAINAGDGLFSIANELILEATEKTESEKGRRIIKEFTETITRVAEGQACDISWVQEKKWDLTEEDYLSMIKRKTGALMATSCGIGAIVGDASKEQYKALEDFGMSLGIGFQIHDDVLNLRGDVGKYGKEIGGDINEGKRTIIVIYTLSVCNSEEKELLIRILDKERNSQEEIESAIELMNKYGSIERAANISKELVEKSKVGLDVLPESKAKTSLLEIANYMTEREL